MLKAQGTGSAHALRQECVKGPERLEKSPRGPEW